MTPPPCPLCGEARNLVAAERVRFDAIWRGLHDKLGAPMPDDVRARHTPADETTRWDCGACGLQFFDPAVPGDDGFYRALDDSGRYYGPWKWEFTEALRRLGPGATVLDVGCGRGDFLAAAKDRGATCVGLELSPSARETARARGLDVRAEALADFAAANAGTVDVACAFHVVEHVRDPAGFARDLARCVRPGGLVLLSAPNPARCFQEPPEVLDAPPHHLTRWPDRAWGALAGAAGCALEGCTHEPADAPTARLAYERRVAAAVRARVPLLGAPVGAVSGWALARGAFAPVVGPLRTPERRASRGMHGFATLATMRRGQ